METWQSIETICGRDNVIRGLNLKLGNGYTVERPIQLVRDLEISSSATETTSQQDKADALDQTNDNVKNTL